MAASVVKSLPEPGSAPPSSQGVMASPSCSHGFQETNALRRTVQMVECSLLHRRPKAESLLAKDPDYFL